MKVLCALFFSAFLWEPAFAESFIDFERANLYEKAAKNCPIKKKENWLGLFCVPGACTNRAVSVEAVDAPGVLTNPNAVDTTGEQIVVSGKEQPEFLFKEISGIKAGKVSVAAANGSEKNGQLTIDVRLGNKDYKLILGIKTEPENGSYAEWCIYEYSARLESRGKSQQLFIHRNRSANGDGDSYPTGGKNKEQVEKVLRNFALKSFRFLGDLDGDEKLDLIVDKGLGRGIEEQLFLSRQTKAEEFVGSSATFSYFNPNDPGC